MNFFICPVCGEELKINNKSYICSKNHTFDIAKSGYVNLFQAKKGVSGIHGDNKFMVGARRDFLDKGYYNCLADTLCGKVSKYYKDNAFLLDAGCGEGYYTSKVYDSLKTVFEDVNICGVDISKNALDVASKRCKAISYAVGSVFKLPIPDKSVDVLMTLFAPFCKEEFQRVLSKNGVMIMVIPSENHLMGLKSKVYDNPYKNEVKSYEIEGFEFVERIKVMNNITLNSNQDIKNLFSMTPYYYKTGETEQKRVDNLDYLETEIEFEILIYTQA